MDIGRTYRPVPVQTATAVVVSQPVSARRWIPDTYQTRTQGVLAEAEHYERRWMPESFETRYDRCGMAYRIFHAGYWTDVFVPARYETRTVTVLIPGHWKEVQVCEPRVAEAPQPAYCGGAYIPRRRWR